MLRKLSDLRGKEAMEVTADLITLGNQVMMDKDMKKYVGKKKIPKGMTESEYNSKYAVDMFNALLKDHQDDVAPILATLDEDSKNLDEYMENSGPEKVVNDIGQLMKDEVFRDLFFASVRNQTSGDKPSSGSASGSTKAH